MIEIKSTDEKLAYEYFCEAIETELKACVGETKSLVQNQKSEISSHILKKTATSIANKLYTQALIKYCITKK